MTIVYLLLLVVIVFDGIAAVLIRLLGKDEERAELPSVVLQVSGALIFLFFVRKFPPLSLIWLIPIVAGFLYGLGNILMFKAYKKGEVSLLAPLSNLSPAITYLLSILLLQESITIFKVVGIILIIYGLSLLKKQKSLISSLKAVLKDRNCQFYFLFLLVFALAKTFDKKATGYFVTASYSFLQFLIPSIFVFLYVVSKKEVPALFKFAKRKAGLGAVTGLAIGIKYAAFYMAISRIELSRVSPISSLSILVSLFLAAVFLKEKVERRWWAAIIMIIGAGLLVYKL